MTTATAVMTIKDAPALQDEAVEILLRNPQLLRALVEFKRGRESGTIEIHWSQGGIAKVFGRPNREYK